MTSVPEGTAASVPAVGQASDEREPNLPLWELDRALAPVRRMVRFATGPQGRAARYLGANLAPHVMRAARLALPDELRTWIRALAEAIEGFDEDPPDAQRERLSRMFAALARIDTVVGLPVPHRLRPVPKVLQIDQPEQDLEPDLLEAERARESVERRARGAADEESEAADDEDEGEGEDDEGPEEFTGDLRQPLAELVPEVAPALADAGVRTVRELLLWRPSVAETLTPIHGAGRELPEGRVAFGGRIRCGFTLFRPGARPERGSVVVGAGPVRVRWAHPPPEGWRQRDRKVVVVGTHAGGVVEEAVLAATDEQTVRIPSWGVPGVADAEVRGVIEGLASGMGQIRDPMPAETLRPLRLPGLAQALAQAHGAVSEGARRRLAFDEVLLAQLAAAIPRNQAARDRGIAQPVLHGIAGRLAQIQDLVLYDDAQAHLEEIKRDLRRQAPMRRLLTGEVGAGKGRLALLAASMVAEAKGQVLMVCADSAEAEARFLHSESVARDAGLVARLVLGRPTRPQLDAVKRGEVHLLFGTFELLEEPIEFRRLGLVVAVEREAFGRACALHGALPAPKPDLLVLTAIPAGPRVLLTAYADLQVSVVVDPERRPAQIEVCRADERETAYAEVRAAVERGEQAMVVFPMVDGRDALDLPDALRLLRVLESEAFAGLRLGLLHGQMAREERVRASEDLLHRRIDVLVSTTRCEEGPAVRTVSVVIIEQADRVDQWRLHRIIGFASRCATRRAKAFLVVGELAESDAAARIERVLSAPNGFHLTEALVELRGVERVVSPSAAPLPSFAWFDSGRDLDLLLAAREEVHRVLRADPALRRGSHADLARDLRARWDRLFAGHEGWPCPVRDEPAPEPKRRRRRRRRRR
jgi:ATP-dependent DNA helicase RecG